MRLPGRSSQSESGKSLEDEISREGANTLRSTKRDGPLVSQAVFVAKT
jgi:hypothetical protein